ncbi:MAG: SGNH/GDSL hydrolase family protein [Spirochaetaceae bacterium]|jgi:lysophospholipase L1-like esterase|nr:SGNH/GDSL hydrolase family protein [Spirochaetaceae bacterium]
MKTVLCYGDSNTWGYNPRGGRYDHTVRWPAVMASLLNGGAEIGTGPGIPPGMPGSGPVIDHGSPERGAEIGAGPAWWVVEEGLNGRTTCLEDPVEGDRNGLRQLIPVLRSHRPLDLVIMMLGVNDLKHRFNPSPYEVSNGAQLVAKAILTSETGPGGGAPRALMVCPPPLIDAPAFRQIIAAGALEISRKLPSYYRACAKECGADFFDAGTVVTAASSVDGVHWEAEDHRRFAQAMAELITRNFS